MCTILVYIFVCVYRKSGNEASSETDVLERDATLSNIRIDIGTGDKFNNAEVGMTAALQRCKEFYTLRICYEVSGMRGKRGILSVSLCVDSSLQKVANLAVG